MTERKNQYTRTFFSLRVKLVLAIFAVLLFSNGLNSTLNYLNFDKRLTQTSDSTYQIVLNETDNDIHQAMSLGLPLSAISNIQSLLDRRLSLVDGISRIQVINNEGQVLFSTGQKPSSDERLISSSISNTFNIEEGRLELYYKVEYLNQIKSTLLKHQLFNALVWILVASSTGYFFLNIGLDFLFHKIKAISSTFEDNQLNDKQRISDAYHHLSESNSQSHWHKFRVKFFPLIIIGLAILLTVISNLGSSYQSLQQFSTIYERQLEQKTNVIGDTLSNMVKRLLDEGVPLNRLNGLEIEFAHYVEQHPELLSITLINQEQSLYSYITQSTTDQSGSDVVYEITPNSQTKLQLDTDTSIIPQMIEESLMDMLTVLIASGLVVIEIILFVCNFMIIKPWQHIKLNLSEVYKGRYQWITNVTSNDELGRILISLNALTREKNKSGNYEQKQLQDYRFVRLPLFILVFAEASSLAFFPNFVASLADEQSWIPQNLLTSLPISLFMFCWALSLPFAGYWSDKVGRRKSLIAGGTITCLGLAATALCINIEMLLVARAFTAIGYGIVFISAQGYITDTTTTHNRTKGMSTFLSAFFSGSLCGAAIGGILAEKLGYSMTFLLASLLALVSVAFVMTFFAKGTSNTTSKPVRLKDFKALLSNKYFALITVCSAIPAKIVLTGFLYYLCPVYLQYLGENSAVSGRVMMTYGLAIILISPISALLVDKWNNKIHFIVFGGLLSAAALLIILFLPGTIGLLLIVIMIGIAHGICVSPQIPLVIDLLTHKELDKGKTIGIFRLTERIGNVTGPLLAGLCLSLFGFQGTFVLFGSILFVSSLALISFFNLFIKRDRTRMEIAK